MERLLYNPGSGEYETRPAVMDWEELQEIREGFSLQVWCGCDLLQYLLSDLRGIDGSPTRDRSGWPVVQLDS